MVRPFSGIKRPNTTEVDSPIRNINGHGCRNTELIEIKCELSVCLQTAKNA